MALYLPLKLSLEHEIMTIFRTSESETENQNSKPLDDYDEDEVVTSKSSKSKKEEKKSDIGSKLEKIAAGHELTPEKSKSSDKRKKSSRKKSVSKERVYITISRRNSNETYRDEK